MENQNNKNKLTIKRDFNFSKEIVFNAFADAKALAEWWGPPGMPITVVKFEFKPKGVFHYKGEMQGKTTYGKFVYQQIQKFDLIEFISSFSDENCGTVRAPFFDKFPLEIFNQLQFSGEGDKTTITLTGYPVNATDEELDFYSQMSANMEQGFNGTFAQLENYLSKVK